DNGRRRSAPIFRIGRHDDRPSLHHCHEAGDARTRRAAQVDLVLTHRNSRQQPTAIGPDTACHPAVHEDLRTRGSRHDCKSAVLGGAGTTDLPSTDANDYFLAAYNLAVAGIREYHGRNELLPLSEPDGPAVGHRSAVERLALWGKSRELLGGEHEPNLGHRYRPRIHGPRIPPRSHRHLKNHKLPGPFSRPLPTAT